MTVCAELHFNKCKEMGVKLDNEQWYERIPKLLETGHEGKAAILWNKQVKTDRTVRNNKPDIIILFFKMYCWPPILVICNLVFQLDAQFLY